MARLLALVLLLAGVAEAAPVQPPQAPTHWSWESYDDRKTACWLYDRLLKECASGEGSCDQTLLHQFQKRCGEPDRDKMIR